MGAKANCHAIDIKLSQLHRPMITRLLLAFAVLAAQSSNAVAESDFQQWVGVALRINLTDTLSIQSDSQLRASNDRAGLVQVQNVVLLAYKASPDVTIAGGYLHGSNYDGGKFLNLERRAREQVTIDNIARIGPAVLGARVRTEQRWRDDLGGTAWRIRPYARVSIPLGDKSAPTLQVSEELFINLNTTAFQSVEGVERLRSAIVLSTPLARNVRLDAGYLNQHRFVRGGEDRGDHVMTASLALSF